jgi:hypothetical protein
MARPFYAQSHNSLSTNQNDRKSSLQEPRQALSLYRLQCFHTALQSFADNHFVRDSVVRYGGKFSDYW